MTGWTDSDCCHAVSSAPVLFLSFLVCEPNKDDDNNDKDIENDENGGDDKGENEGSLNVA